MLREKVKMADIRREVGIQAKIRHPNILGIADVFVEPSRVYLVFPLMTGGSVCSFLKKSNAPSSDTDTKRIVTEILTGVDHLHESRIVHRDIKPDNILLDKNGIVKIADFGSAIEILHGSPVMGFVGTPGFVAPEIVALQPYGFPIILRERVDLEKVRTEAQLQRKAYHQNVLALCNYFVTASRVYLVFPFMTGGSLSSFLQGTQAPPSENVTKKLLAGMFAGLAHLHSSKIVHRDVKPANLLIDHNGCLKIGDFGLVVELADDQMATGYVGTSGYMAPEILNIDPYCFPVDMFSAGVTILDIINNPIKLEPCPLDEIQGYILDETPAGLRDILISILQVYPPSRATAADLHRHPWLSDE